MNRHPKNQDPIQDPIDAIMAHDDHILPTSGFLARVMEKVEEEAAAPPPLPFPWKRAVPGIVLTAGVLGWATVESVRYVMRQAATGFALPAIQTSVPLGETWQQAGWVTAALAISAASYLLSRKLAGRSSLF